MAQDKPKERNSEQKIVIAVITVLAMKALGLDVETVKALLLQAQDVDAQVKSSTGYGASELGMIVVAAVYNWGRVTLKKGREALDV